jgi:opacity protein-like surface antigen
MKKLLCFTLMCFAAPLLQASTGFFVTVAGGQSQFRTKYTTRYVDATRNSVPNSEVNEHGNYWAVGGGYSFTDFLRVTAGYEDWGKVTGPSMSPTGEIYPLTVGAKGYYASFAPMIHVIPFLSIDPEVGVLYSDVHLRTNFQNDGDPNIQSGYSSRFRYGLGISLHPPGPFVIGIKYLQIDLPEAKFRAGSSFFTDKVRPRTILLTAQYSF